MFSNNIKVFRWSSVYHTIRRILHNIYVALGIVLINQ